MPDLASGPAAPVAPATDAVRSEIVRVARALRERGLAIGTSGNVGVRLADGRLAITPSTMDYDEMTPDDVVIVEADGAPSEGRNRPSSELALHVALFAARPDIRAIVHSHSPFATAWATTRRPLPAVHYVLAVLVGAGRDTLRVADYATFGTDELARNTVTALGADRPAFSPTTAPSRSRGRSARPCSARSGSRSWRCSPGARTRSAARSSSSADELDRARDQMSRFPRQEPPRIG